MLTMTFAEGHSEYTLLFPILLFLLLKPGGSKFLHSRNKIVNLCHDSCTSVKGPSVQFGLKIMSCSREEMLRNVNTTDLKPQLCIMPMYLL